MKDGLVRADTLPLVFRALGAEACRAARGCACASTGTDLLTLDLHASVLARIDDPTTTADDVPVDETEAEDEPPSAGPLTLAIDVDDRARPPTPRRRRRGLTWPWAAAALTTLQLALLVLGRRACRAADACASSTRKASTASSRTRRWR